MIQFFQFNIDNMMMKKVTDNGNLKRAGDGGSPVVVHIGQNHFGVAS